ncbi:hypothetical protein ACQP0C_32055 [Nocardia sp. CA-129566]|uniref:hypothetical protein n=1 Tax=Nocardia sp. CA-129566 TaxID=3239976 RepID=UPI003D96FA8D
MKAPDVHGRTRLDPGDAVVLRADSRYRLVPVHNARFATELIDRRILVARSQ